MHRSASTWRHHALLIGLLAFPPLVLAAPSAPPATSPKSPPPAATPPLVPQRPQDVSPGSTTNEKGVPVLTAPSREEIEARRAAAREALRNRPNPNVDPNLAPSQNLPANVARPAGHVAPVTESTVIRFEPAELDLGEMVAEIAKTGNVRVHNITDVPVTISRLVPSCGCTTAPAPKDPIAPGEYVDIPITLKPGAKQGVTLAKKVNFMVDGHPPVVFTVKGNVAEYVRIVPEFLTSNMEDPESGKITLTAADGEAFKILGVNPAIVTDYTDEAKTEHIIHIDWAKWQEAGSGVKLAIAIDHPRIPSVAAMIKRPVTRQQGENVLAARDAAAARPTVDPAAAALVAAARRGDLAGLSAAIAEGAKLNDPDRLTGRTALHWAAREGQVDAVAELLKAGADLGVTDRTGKTALGSAAEAGKADTVKALIAAGAVVDHRDVIQGTALIWAAGLGNTETVKALLEAGANPNIVDVNGLTPLLWAVGIGEPSTVAVLLDAKADPKLADVIDGDNALIRAARSGKEESLKLLLERGVATDPKNHKGATALLVAAGSGTLEKVKALVAAKADLTAVDNSGRGVLDYAQNRTDPSRDAVIAFLTEATGK